MKKAINLGCGNQHFQSTSEIEWLNMDLDDRDGPIEVAGDVSNPLPFEAETFDLITASHIVEHIEMSKVEEVLKDWMRCLKKDGSLVITVPDARALAERYITRDIDHFTFAVNMTGPWHGKDTDHHSWCYDYDELKARLKDFSVKILTSEDLTRLNLVGMIAIDWWIAGIVVTHKK